MPLGGINALHFFRKAELQPGEHVLINGAGGSFGTFAVQLAKHYGAEVTAVDHPDKLEMIRSLGADHVIDYTREDFTENVASYDVIFNMVVKCPYARALRQRGRDARDVARRSHPGRDYLWSAARKGLLPQHADSQTWDASANTRGPWVVDTI